MQAKFLLASNVDVVSTVAGILARGFLLCLALDRGEGKKILLETVRARHC